MMVETIIEELRHFSWTYVDTGFRQGREAVLQQYQKQFEDYEQDPDHPVEESLAFWQIAITDMIERVAPYAVPEAYIFFLEHYGGLAIDGNQHHFSLLGIGPMVETWYGYMNSGDHADLESAKLGWLELGALVFRADHRYIGQRVLFFLDLAGTIQYQAVIGIGPWDGVTPRTFNMLNNIRVHSDKWKILANSFNEFLEQAARTRGSFTYT